MMTKEVVYLDPLWRLLQQSGNETDDGDRDFGFGKETGDDDAAGDVEIDANQVLRDTFIVYGSLMVGLVLLFCWVRRRFPKAFTLRQWVDKIKSDIAKDQFGFFSWMRKVHSITEEEMVKECGMDALCFTRIANMGYKIAVVGSFNAIWLMVVYKTAKNADDTSQVEGGVLEFTISHIPEGSNRFIATTLAAYIFFGYVMYVIMQDFEWFTEKRHEFLSRPTPRNYSIFVRNIPPHFLNNQALETFMRSCFAGDSVIEASVMFTAGHLAKTQANRADALFRLEHALALYSLNDGKRPTHYKGVGGTVGLGDKVDSIQEYKQELIQLNRQVDEGISFLQDRIESINTEPTWTTANDDKMVVYNGPQDLKDDDKGDEEEGSKEPNKTADEQGSTPLQDDDGNVEEGKKGKHNTFSKAGKVVNEVGQAATGAVGNAVNTAGQLATGVAGDAMELAAGAARMITGTEDGIPYPSGFVVFSNLATANAALQTVSHPTPFCMDIGEAPEPDDIDWLNIGRTHKDLQAGIVMSTALTVTICLLWTIPMSFIASISSLDGLRSEFEFIDDMLDAAPFLEPVLGVLAPLLVVVANNSLKIILYGVTLLEGLVSGAAVQAALFVKLASFFIIQTFFISAISGSVIENLHEMIEQPGIIVEVLATALPAQATYFIQVTFVNMVATFGFEGFRLYPIAMAILRTFIGPRLTDKEKAISINSLGINPLSDPFEFEHAYYTSLMALYFMVLLVYSVISPITNFVLAFIFIVMNTLFRHQFIYIYPSVRDSGGKIWMAFIKIIVVCMLVAQLTIVGLLSLKKATIASPMFFPLLVITFLFYRYIHQKHFNIAEFLPMRSCLRQDSAQPDLSFLKGSYLQPELKADRHVWPDSMSEMEKEALEQSVEQLEGTTEKIEEKEVAPPVHS